MMQDKIKPELSGQPSTRMSGIFSIFHRLVPMGRSVAWIVLSIALLLTFGAWYFARDGAIKRAQTRFNFRVKTIEAKISERLQAYEFLLQGGSGLFSISNEVTRENWRTYVNKLQIDQYYPGIQGIGFSKRILPSEKEAHIRQIRGEGFPQYTIYPDGERAEYTSILFLEPFDWRNQRAFGYDMFSQATRKEAMIRARDTGKAALSGKVTLVQETNKDIQSGFLIYQAIYRKGEPQETSEQRRKALLGYVYSPFRMNDFMKGILAEKEDHVNLQIFDGDKPLKETLQYQSDNAEEPHNHPEGRHFATNQVVLEYANHNWLLSFVSSKYFEENISSGGLNFILVLGLTISILLFGMVLSLSKSRSQAIALANTTVDLEKANIGLKKEIMEREQAEESLRQSESKYRRVLENSPVVVYQFKMSSDWAFTFPYINDTVKSILGVAAEDVMKDPSELLGMVHPEDQKVFLEGIQKSAESNESYHAIIRLLKNEEERWIEARSTPDRMEDGSILWDGIFIDITERIKSEDQLRTKEAQYRMIYNSTPAMMHSIDNEANLLSVSDYWLKILDYSRDEVIGKKSTKFLTKESYKDATEIYMPQFFKNGYINDVPYQFKKKNGEIIDVLLSAVSKKDCDNKIIEALAVLIDVTEYKQTQDALFDREQKYKTLFEESNDGIILHDLQGKILDTNTNANKILGYDKDEINRWSIKMLHPESEKRISRQALEQTKSKGHFKFETKFIKKDGSIIDVDISSSVVDYKNSIVQGIFRDITERKKIEKALIESEKKYKFLFESMNQGVFYQSADGTFLDINDAALEMFGITRDQFLGRDPYDSRWKVIKKDNSLMSAEEYPSLVALKTGKVIENYEMGIFNPKKNDYTWLSVSAKALFKENEKNPYQVFATLHDITERKRAEQVILESEERLQSFMDSATDGFILFDSKLNLIEMNKTALETVGVEKQDVIGKNIIDTVPNIKETDRYNEYKKVMKTGVPFYIRDITNHPLTGDKHIELKAFKVNDGLGMIFNDITKIKLAEETLIRSEERFRQLFKHMPSGAVQVLPDGGIELANLVAQTTFGLSHDTITSRYVKDWEGTTLNEDGTLCPIEELPVSQCLKTGEPQGPTVIGTIRPDGGVSWAVYSAMSMEGTEPSESKSVIVTISDITEHKLAEEALRETNARHSAMVANIGDVIGIMGADGIMKYKSPNIERWFGWKPEDLVGTDGWETVHPEDIGRIQKEFYDLLEKNDASTTKIEYRYKCKDGTYTWVELTAVNCINDTTINGILLNYHDISERKQSENEMRVTENLLKEAQRVAHIGHWELDPSIGTPVWSDEIYRIFGLNPNESEPSFTKHETYIHPDDWLVLERAVEKGSMDGSPFDLIFRIMRPSGETSWMHAIGTTLMSNTGEVIKLFGTAQDITEDKKKTEELVKSKAELQNLATYLQNVIEKERTLLAREIHDELGQVLTALKMDITWLGDKIKDRKLVEKSLQIMEDIDQAIITVQSISTQLRPGILDHLGLFSAIEWQVEEFRKRTGINCELIIENEDVKIDPDSSTAAFRILQEALTNIIRHAEAKKVIVRSDMVNKRLDLEVTDNGIGMDIKNKSMSSAYGLTGIRERVRALNGKVSIDSTPGEGTTIRASIPVKQRELKS